MLNANVIGISCFLDEFCKYFETELQKRAISTSGNGIGTVQDACLTVKS